MKQVTVALIHFKCLYVIVDKYRNYFRSYKQKKEIRMQDVKENHDRTLIFPRQKSVFAEDNVNVLY